MTVYVNWLRRKWQEFFIKRRYEIKRMALRLGILAAILGLSMVLGYRTSLLLAILVVGAAVGGVVASILLKRPNIALYAFVPVALIGHFEFSTGTAVVLNPITLFVPALFGVWVLEKVRRRNWHFARSRTNVPLLLFVLGNLFSLLLGIVLWDPNVPRSADFTVIQLAQWAIFAFSAFAYWLMGNMVRDETRLRRLTLAYLVIAGILSILYVIPRVGYQVHLMTSGALYRAPFWMLLLSVAGGQLLFNRELSSGWRLFLVTVLVATQVFAFYWTREQASIWVSLFASAGVLAWLRWPQLRWPVIILISILAVTGILSTAVYEFAGGDEEWEKTGGSRLELIGRVVEVTMRNPITGLGPAAYRLYAGMKPLQYERALWFEPWISSHNNYVDLFSHGGLVGLGLFLWFAIRVTRLGLHLKARFTQGFLAGYVNAMLAAWAGALILMAFVDWILPFVYNVGFVGFQASVLVWFFMGGLVVMEQFSAPE